jgi:hypothetical protein
MLDRSMYGRQDSNLHGRSGAGQGYQECTSGGFQSRCVCQFHHARINLNYGPYGATIWSYLFPSFRACQGLVHRAGRHLSGRPFLFHHRQNQPLRFRDSPIVQGISRTLLHS